MIFNEAMLQLILFVKDTINKKDDLNDIDDNDIILPTCMIYMYDLDAVIVAEFADAICNSDIDNFTLINCNNDNFTVKGDNYKIFVFQFVLEMDEHYYHAHTYNIFLQIIHKQMHTRQ